MASSGWCRHPLRQDLQHMVLVRKNELACRQSLGGEDLWEAKDGVPERLAPEKSQLSPRLIPDRGSTSSAEMTAVRTATRRESEIEQQTDKIAAIGVARDAVTEIRPSFGHRSALNTPPRDSVDSTWGHQSPTQLRTDTRPSLNGADVERTDRTDTSRDKREPRPATDTQAEAPIFGYSSTLVTDATRPRPSGDVPGAPQDDRAARATTASPSSPTQLPRGVEPGGRGEPHTSGVQADRFESMPGAPEAGGGHTTRRSGTTEKFEVTGEPVDGANRSATRPALGGNAMAPSSSKGSSVPENEPAPVIAESDEPSRATFGISSSAAKPNLPDDGLTPPTFDRGTLIAKQSSQIPVIPRCCGTCLDFRPAEGGKRGMCVNRLAFEQPTMVSADDIACASSIGDWWVPNNDWWEQKVDKSHHGRPTPNFDSLIKQLIERYPKAKREAR